LPPNARVSIQQLDADHGNVLAEYAAMGKPLDPTGDQVEELNHETALSPPLQATLTAGKLQIKLTPNELALIKVQP
jgi:xylan 1,4-beta-xylosidase